VRVDVAVCLLPSPLTGHAATVMSVGDSGCRGCASRAAACL